MRHSTLVRTSMATAVAAGVGAVGTRPDSAWYLALDKPGWQPPRGVFPVVWTPLYALIAVAAARALDSLANGISGGIGSPGGTSGTGEEQRKRFRRVYRINLALNAAWTPLFFRARSPRLALAEIVALDASTVSLLLAAWRADRRAGAALLPYLAWVGFATALNAAIAARNPGSSRGPGPSRNFGPLRSPRHGGWTSRTAAS